MITREMNAVFKSWIISLQIIYLALNVSTKFLSIWSSRNVKITVYVVDSPWFWIIFTLWWLQLSWELMTGIFYIPSFHQGLSSEIHVWKAVYCNLLINLKLYLLRFSYFGFVMAKNLVTKRDIMSEREADSWS